MSAADRLADATKRLRETRAEIERLSPGEAKASALYQLDRIAENLARGVANAVRRPK